MFGNCSSKCGMDGLGLYVHVPFCRTKCRYCGFYSEPIIEYDAGAVVCAMIAEMERYEGVHGVKTVYIGGGSPSSLAREHLLRLVGEAARQNPAAEEFTVEVNPGQVDEALLRELQRAGVNRLSIGAQSLIQRELDFLGRGHTVGCIGEAVRQGRAAGFDNISLDLIFAIPGSDIDSWKHNLEGAIELGVEHISAYSLSYEEGTPLSRDAAAGVITPVDEDTDRAMYELTIDELAGAGIEQYEISNFARRGFECRHNLNYWANGGYIGIGPGATSYLRGTRSTNFADIDRYVEAVTGGASAVRASETLGGLERACETAVLNLRRRCGIDLAEFKSRTGFDVMELFAGPIQTYQERGLMKKENGRVFLTRQALGIADSVLCDFAGV
ncbi:MAG TPA: radical SAM family heme chaperone HemW [Sedimentisphaerales bacterium]|nr:radical SAM family heme chaperone HemW [Sedimentisphaerales bacterium]